MVKARMLPSDAAAPAEDGGAPAGDDDRYLSIGDDAQDRDQTVPRLAARAQSKSNPNPKPNPNPYPIT